MVCLLFVLGVNQSKSQDQTSESRRAIEIHKKGSESAVISASLFEARTFINKGSDSLPYRLLKPINYDSSKKYPLILYFSSIGGRGNDQSNRK